MGLKDARGLAKAERQFFARHGLQACIICGRYFTKRAERVCSMSCAAKAEEDEARPGRLNEHLRGSTRP